MDETRTVVLDMPDVLKRDVLKTPTDVILSVNDGTLSWDNMTIAARGSPISNYDDDIKMMDVAKIADTLADIPGMRDDIREIKRTLKCLESLILNYYSLPE